MMFALRPNGVMRYATMAHQQGGANGAWVIVRKKKASSSQLLLSFKLATSFGMPAH